MQVYIFVKFVAIANILRRKPNSVVLNHRLHGKTLSAHTDPSLHAPQGYILSWAPK